MAVRLIPNGVYLRNGRIVRESEIRPEENAEEWYKGTIAHRALDRHNLNGPTSKARALSIRFDCLASHDITYVGIIQAAKACGLKKFPVPYVLTNCHNSLCAVGGTINADDHEYGKSAARKYGGIYVPPFYGVIHSYMRERMAGCGKMILASDSHTRYGALGAMGVGEGGGELCKQLLSGTYDMPYPRVIGVEVTGAPRRGVGPHDVALELVRDTFESGFAKNAVLEFFGPGIRDLSVEYRNGIDVMTTETACLTSVWETDDRVREYLEIHGRGADYAELRIGPKCRYDALIRLDLSSVEPMIALPFHPSNAHALRELLADPVRILSETEARYRDMFENAGVRLTDKIRAGRVWADQAVVAGCAGGTYDNLCEALSILRRGRASCDAPLSVYPGSLPTFSRLADIGAIGEYVRRGAIVKPAFCGPCFGACDAPANFGLSIRHATRNFPSREGARPGEGQFAMVALMDARSIAATVARGGALTPATEIEYDAEFPPYEYDASIYAAGVLDRFGRAEPDVPLRLGPNIADWPEFPPLADNLVLKICAAVFDPVTTTDELIPSGETSSYRSNPVRLAEHALSRIRPEYVGLAKSAFGPDGAPSAELRAVAERFGISDSFRAGSAIYAVRPGDGSAREQAASCQRVLGGAANIAKEYATKRYRSNLINWGIIPFLYDGEFRFEPNDCLVLRNVRAALRSGSAEAAAVRGDSVFYVTLRLDGLTPDERKTLEAGCLINRNRSEFGGSD